MKVTLIKNEKLNLKTNINLVQLEKLVKLAEISGFSFYEYLSSKSGGCNTFSEDFKIQYAPEKIIMVSGDEENEIILANLNIVELLTSSMFINCVTDTLNLGKSEKIGYMMEQSLALGEEEGNNINKFIVNQVK